jgi:hypothetical protein
MESTAMKLMKLLTLVPLILLAGYALLILKESLFGIMFLGFEAVYYFLLTKRDLHYNTSEERTLEDVGRMALGWTFILLFSFFLFRDVAYSYILLGLAWVPIGILLMWARLTERWEILLQSRFKQGDEEP